MSNFPTIPNAIMLDKMLADIQQGLVTCLSWLDVAFGKAQKIVKKVNGRTLYLPNVYCGGWNGHGDNDYIEVSPDSHIGNFSWFEINDPQLVDADKWARRYEIPFALIVWFDLRKVYGTSDNRNTEKLKAEIIKVLNGNDEDWHLSRGRIAVERIYEKAENIYRGYSISEIDNQYLIHPFGGFRFEGTLSFEEVCF